MREERRGESLITKRRDTRLYSASTGARVHTLKNLREVLLARSGAAAGVEVVAPTIATTTPAPARLERRVR